MALDRKWGSGSATGKALGNEAAGGMLPARVLAPEKTRSSLGLTSAVGGCPTSEAGAEIPVQPTARAARVSEGVR